MMKIAGIGDLTLDIILPGLKTLPEWGRETEIEKPQLRLGGNLGNFALGAAALGLDVSLFADLGEDDDGEKILEELGSTNLCLNGIRRRTDSDTSRTYACVREDGERFMLTYTGVLSKLEELVSSADVRGFGLIFLSGWCLNISADALISRIRDWRSDGALIACDLLWNEGLWKRLDELRSIVRELDLLFLNEEEILALTSETTLESATAALTDVLSAVPGGGTAVLKLGKQGAALLKGGEASFTPAHPVKPLDTVGAGDLFNAGYLFARYNKSLCPQSALVYASVFSALSISRDRENMPDAAETDRAYEMYGR